MEFIDGEVVNITWERTPQYYLLKKRDLNIGLNISNLTSSGEVKSHGVFYNGNLYGPNAIEMLAEKTHISVAWESGRVMLKGDLH